MSSSSAISSGVGSRPSCWTSWRSTWTTLLSFSTMCTGMRIVRRLVGDRAGDGLADPPGRVGRELVAAAVVELLDGADQAERALLDQVEEREAAAEVALRDRDDEAQVGLDHLLLGRACRRARCACASSTSCSAVSSGTRPIERRYSRSESRVGSTREVDLGLLALVAARSASPLPRSASSLVALDAVGRAVRARRPRSPLLVQIRVQLLDLLLGDLDLLRGRSRSASKVRHPALLTLGDQRP